MLVDLARISSKISIDYISLHLLDSVTRSGTQLLDHVTRPGTRCQGDTFLRFLGILLAHLHCRFVTTTVD